MGHAIDITGFLDHGIASLQAHSVYLANLSADFDPTTFLRQQALEAGQALGCEHAVSFEVILI
jgi:hypothetical protein